MTEKFDYNSPENFINGSQIVFPYFNKTTMMWTNDPNEPGEVVPVQIPSTEDLAAFGVGPVSPEDIQRLSGAELLRQQAGKERVDALMKKSNEDFIFDALKNLPESPEEFDKPRGK